MEFNQTKYFYRVPSKFKTIELSKNSNKSLPATYNLSKEYPNNLYPIYRQYVCGSCWAFAVAALISDRYAIRFQVKNPIFSPTSIMSGIYCKMKRSPDIDLYNACEGGSAFDALALLSQITNSKDPVYCDPLVYESKDDLRNIFKPMECDNYDWCEKNPVCNTSISNGSSNEILDHFQKDKSLNLIVPPFTEKCQIHKPTNNFEGTISTQFFIDKLKPHKFKLSRPYALEDIKSIKNSIFQKGTVINNFVIYPDFIYKPNNTDLYYTETNGVYIHKKGCKIYNMGDNDKDNNDKFLGFHSTTVIGWGIEKFNKKKLFDQLKIKFVGNLDDTIDIEYWICRNIWGKDWNGNGEFKLAITNKKLGINTLIGADIPINISVNSCYTECGEPCDKGNKCSSSVFGGCCAVDILERDEEDKSLNNESSLTVIKNFIRMYRISTKQSLSVIEDKRIISNKQKNLIKISLLIVSLMLVININKKVNCKNGLLLILILFCIILLNKM